MHLLSLGLYLCEEAPEQAAPPAVTGGPAELPKATIGQQLRAALASKSTLQAEIDTLKATVKAKTTLAETLQTQLTAANEKIVRLEAYQTEVEDALKASKTEVGELQAKEVSIDKRAQEKVAQLGFPAAQLPTAVEDKDAKEPTAADKKAALEARLEKATSMKERMEILRAHNAAQKTA